MSAAEQKVKKLARLPSNSICANCGTAKKFGFSTVCIKFHTFVCNNCKSSHQAISHRCKSLTMSSWTDAEVAELELKGNDYARRTWLKNAPPEGSNGRPKEGDHVDVFKRFVVDVYEKRKYYGEDSGPVPQQVATAVPVSRPLPPATAPRRPVQAPPPAAAIPATPTADLLGFAAAPATVSASAPAMFEANFDAFGATPAASVPANGSAFGFMASTPSAAPIPAPVPAVATPSPANSVSNSGFSFLSKPPPAATAVAAPTPSSSDFADFAGLSISSPAPARPLQASSTSSGATTKKPVMALSAANEKASLISSMDGLSTPNHVNNASAFAGLNNQAGFGTNGMNHNMMGGGNNNSMLQQQQQHMMMMMQQQQRGMGGGMNTMHNPMMAGGMNMNYNMGGVMNMNSNTMGMNMNYNHMGATAGMGIGMMTPQQMMMMNQQNNVANNRNTKSTDAMSSLSMTGMDINAWTTGKK